MPRVISRRRRSTTGSLPFVAALERAGRTVVGRLRTHFSGGHPHGAAIEERLYAQTWLSPDYNLLPKLKQTEVKTLLIHGADDLFPPRGASRIVDAIPGARLVVIEECGHFAFLECPDCVMAETIAHLSQR
jgi:pimeloyl-ACP methyl ester carboxylesterase